MVTLDLPHPVYVYIYTPPPAQGHAPQTLRTTPGPTAAVVALTVRAASLPPGGADGPRPDGGGGGSHGAGAPPPPEDPRGPAVAPAPPPSPDGMHET